MTDVKNNHRKARRGLLARTVLATTLALSGAALAQTSPTSQPVLANQGGAQLIASGLDPSGTKITLSANQSRLLKLSGPVRTIDVTQPDAVMAKVVSPTDVVLTGRKPGTSQLVLWDDAGR